MTCTFTSIEGCASCGRHLAFLEHTSDGWRCPYSGVVFPFGLPLGSKVMMMDVKLKETRTKDYSCTMSADELIQIFNAYNSLSHYIPSDAELTITVPSGGDYSGDSLTLDEAGGLTVTWRETSYWPKEGQR